MPRTRVSLGLLLAIAVYVGLRAVVLLLAFDQVAMTNYELYPMGTLPKAILVGAEVPLRAYYDNAAGQLVTGLLALPLYVLFGDGWMTLKLVPAGCGLGALLCVWALLDRHVSRRAANLGALAFALGPAELVLKYSLLASGNHFENLFFTSLAILCTYRLHVTEPARRGRWLLLAGFTSGLAVFVFLGAVVPVGILAVMHLGLRGWRGSLRDLRAFAPAFALGLLPLIVLNLVSDGRGVNFIAAKFEGGGEARDWGLVFERMGHFLTEGLTSASFHHPFGAESLSLPNLALVAALGLAWLVALPAVLRGGAQVARGVCGGAPARFEATLSLPFVLFLPLATLAFGLSDLRIDDFWPQRLAVAGYRYFLPILLFGTVLVAAVSDRLIAAQGARRVLGVALIGTLLATSAWNVAWLRAGTPGVGSHYRGWNFMQVARGLFNESVALDHARRVAIAEALPPVHRANLYRGIGFTEAQRWVFETARAEDIKDLVVLRTYPMPVAELVERYPPRARLDVARGAGVGLRTYVGYRGQSDANLELLRDGLLVTVASGDPWAWMLVEGAASIQDYPFPWSEVPRVLRRSRRLMDLLPENLRATFVGGLGEVCGRYFARRIPAEEKFLSEYLHGLYQFGGEPLLEGVGRGMALEGAAAGLTPALRAAIPRQELQATIARGYDAALEALD